MHSVFYFSALPISLEKIADQAQAAGFRCEWETENSPENLRVYYGGATVGYDRDGETIRATPREDRWLWSVYSRSEWGELEPDERAELERRNPAAGFQIECHVPSVEALVPLLRGLMERYGGWVSVDDDRAVTYDGSNIGELATTYVERLRSRAHAFRD